MDNQQISNSMNDIYVLTNYSDYSTSINEPLKRTQRIKYTCFDVSKKYLVFGASSGSLYIFNRKPCRLLQLVQNKYGPVNLVGISPNEKFIAFSTLKGVICVYVVNLSQSSAPQVITAKLGEVIVNYIHWSANEKQFYYGDRNGQVNLVTLSFFMGRSLLSISIHPILFLDAPIVQIDDFDALLLVSNYTKCILCNTEYEEYKQIGNRPRDGYYGACFSIMNTENLMTSRIFCARPGSRLWEVDLEGNVLQTHQFKAALACPPTKIMKIDKTSGHTEDSIVDQNTFEYTENEYIIDFPPQTLQFSKLQSILNDFILTFTDFGLYIFDPKTSNVVLWSNHFERIADCKVVGSEIFIYTNGGSIFSVRLQTIHSYAVDLVQQHQKLLDCTLLLKKNVKYFADKAKEEYSLVVLNDVKRYLIDTNQYELLNDLSVIFDSITQREIDVPKITKRQHETGGGVYVLENAFCDNLKMKSNSDKQLKDALLTVTGKFGRNVIKYKFNIFNDEQKSLVKELIPTERSIPFKEINEQLEKDEEIVCNRSVGRRSSLLKEKIITDEEKTIYNLYLIFKSSKISNINFLDRYSLVFDEYSSGEIINLLAKLEAVMIENGDSGMQAKKNCFEMYFNYVRPELIWEMDEISIEFIISGFVLINSGAIIRCDTCDFPIRFNNFCQFHDLGENLIKFLWSRNEQERCYNILRQVPAIMDVICRFYIQEEQTAKVIPITLNYGDSGLFEEAAKLFDHNSWDKCFDLFAGILNGRFNCINCDKFIQYSAEEQIFYTWNCFLNIALEFLDPQEILGLILKYSNLIPNDAVDRQFYTKCLLK